MTNFRWNEKKGKLFPSGCNQKLTKEHLLLEKGHATQNLKLPLLLKEASAKILQKPKVYTEFTILSKTLRF